MNPSQLLRRLRPGQIVFLGLLLAAALAFSLFVWWAEVRREEATGRVDFERNVDQVYNTLASRLETFQAVLRAGAGAWAEHPDMGVNQWGTFIQRALVEPGYPGVEGVAFAQPVAVADRDRFVADIRRRLWRDFAIHPDPGHDPAAVITHFAPLSRTGRAVGFDIASHPGRWQAAELARDSGRSVLSAPLTLMTQGSDSRSFVLVHPVYRADYPTTTIAQRRKALMGWLVMGLHAPTLIGSLADSIKDPLMDIRVFAAESDVAGGAIYASSRASHPEGALFETRRVLDTAGVRWSLRAQRHLPPSALWFGAGPLTLLGLCVAFSLALTAAALLLLVSREQSRQLAVQAMGQLDRAERTLAGITATAPGTVFQWLQQGESGRFAFVSPQASAMFGVGPEALVADWRVLPFAAEDLERWPQAMAEAAAGGADWQAEGRYQSPDGTLHWWKGTASASPAEDGAVAVNGIFVDITEQKDAQRQLAEREQTYREMFERTSAVKVLVDPESGDIVDANAAARRYYGYDPDVTAAGGIHQVSLLETDDLKALMARSAAGEQQFFRSRHRLASGEVREVEVHLGPVRMHGRQYVHAIVHDVTDRERYQAELLEKSAKLESSNAELQQFSYVASHDLQEPLRTIASFLQLLERRYNDKLDDQGREFIGFAVDAAGRLQAMIQDLLEYSRVGTRGRPFAETAMDDVFAVARGNLTSAIAESGATVEAAALPVVVADQVQMVSLLQNLMGNALKYRREDVPPHIRVWAEDEPERWVFAIADNGIGIEPQYFDRIFLVFQRLHTREKYGGTGIGLALCRKIVQRHGGDIWVESEPGQGTTFRFSLPKRPKLESA